MPKAEKYKWLSQRNWVLVYNAFTRSPIKIQINSKTIIEFGSRIGHGELLRPRFVLFAKPRP
jgi:hypothetical protein